MRLLLLPLPHATLPLMQLSIIINFTSKCRPQQELQRGRNYRNSHFLYDSPRGTHCCLLYSACCLPRFVAMTRSYRRQAVPSFFDMTFFLVAFCCYRIVRVLLSAMHFSSSISSCQLQINQSISQSFSHSLSQLVTLSVDGHLKIYSHS